jgi:hypothetical protein
MLNNSLLLDGGHDMQQIRHKIWIQYYHHGDDRLLMDPKKHTEIKEAL